MEHTGVDVIDFDAVRADFEAAKGSEEEKSAHAESRSRGEKEK